MSLSKFVKTVMHRSGISDQITVAVSQAAQRNQVAMNNLDGVLKETVDKPEHTLALRRVSLP